MLRAASALLRPLTRSFHFPRSGRRTKKGIVVSQDGGTIICWHPEKAFPYEHTRPMPEAEAKDNGSPLGDSYVQELSYKSGPNVQELALMFGRTWQNFRPRPILKKRRPETFSNDTERDSM